MMHTMYENAAKYHVCWIVSFRKHFSETDTFFCFLLYYVERCIIYITNNQYQFCRQFLDRLLQMATPNADGPYHYQARLDHADECGDVQ